MVVDLVDRSRMIDSTPNSPSPTPAPTLLQLNEVVTSARRR